MAIPLHVKTWSVLAKRFMIIKARDDITERGIAEKIGKLKRKSIKAQLKKEIDWVVNDIMTGNREMLSIHSFVEYLISKEKNKKFVTSNNTIIGQNKDILEKNHNCEIIILTDKKNK